MFLGGFPTAQFSDRGHPAQVRALLPCLTTRLLPLGRPLCTAVRLLGGISEIPANYYRFHLTQRSLCILASCSIVTPLSTSLLPCSDRHRGHQQVNYQVDPTGKQHPSILSCSHPSISMRDSQLKWERLSSTIIYNIFLNKTRQLLPHQDY